MRIVKWQYKLLYVALGLMIGAILLRVLPVQGDNALVAGSVFDLALFVVGARIFRGESEDIRAPRSWWRITNKRALSLRLGVLFSVLAALYLVTTVLDVLQVRIGTAFHGTLDQAPGQVNGAALGLVLAFLYLNCAVRLNRMPTPRGVVAPHSGR
jgi:hypothetical protein